MERHTVDSVPDHHSRRFLGKPKIIDLPPGIAEAVLQLLGIDANQSEEAGIRVLDQIPEDDLILVHYYAPIQGVEHIRGLVIDTGAPGGPRVVCSGFPYTEDITTDDPEEIRAVLQEAGYNSNATVTAAYEGTILRMFQGRVTGKWYLSTHRKIEGRRSRWSGPTFGQMFDEAWGDEEVTGKSGYMYVFLVSHPENRLVCQIPEPCLRLVSVFAPSGKDMVELPFDEWVSPNSRVQIQTPLAIDSSDALLEQYVDLDHMACTGLLVTIPGEVVKCYKLIPPEYTRLRGLRGNEPNLRMRYLEFKIDEIDGPGKIQELRELFPEKASLFNEVEKDYGCLVEYLRGLYEYRYKQGNYLRLPREEYYILETTRRNYDPDLTLLENMWETLLTSNARQLNAMIKHMREERDEGWTHDTDSSGRFEPCECSSQKNNLEDK